MILDGHIHILGDLKIEDFKERLIKSKIDGGIIISLPPKAQNWRYYKNNDYRLKNVMGIASKIDNTFPFYWLDPLEETAIEQIDEAVKEGISGFKIISIDDYPNNPRAMKAYDKIAYYNKPILFHSGILWNNKNSSNFNRPANYECLCEIDGLRFALAHISWPWIDECLAVFGKFIYANNNGRSNQMFIDITPGTPEIYRNEALRKIYKIGYKLEKNIIFGLDNNAENYDVEWAKKWFAIDNKILNELDLPDKAIKGLYGENLLNFITGVK